MISDEQQAIYLRQVTGVDAAGHPNRIDGADLTVPDGDFVKRLWMRPGFDTGAPQWGKHGMDMGFELQGPQGAISFSFSTGWVPGQRGISPALAEYFPAGRGVGYHWPTPIHDGEKATSSCPLIRGGGTCFYDVSGLDAEEMLRAFTAGGMDAVWTELRAFYDRLANGHT